MLHKRKIVYIIGLLLLVLVGLYLYTRRNEEFTDFLDENDNVIDINSNEKEEQDQAQEYIQADDCVLELGARYGTVSAIINKKLANPLHHIAVEPDTTVWAALEKNKQNSQSQFQIIKGLISNKKFSLTNDSYASRQIVDESSTIPHVSFQQVKAMVGVPFTVLVIDCEGCIEHFLTENEEVLDTVRLILMEEDVPDTCNYTAVKKLLSNYSFKEVKPGGHSVWMKQ
jgi:FkbM family methyltransferase